MQEQGWMLLPPMLTLHIYWLENTVAMVSCTPVTGFPLDSVQSFLGEPRHSRYNSGDSSQDKSIYEGLSGFLSKSCPSTVLLCSRVSYWITSRTNWLFLYGPGSENIRLGGARCFHREYSVLLLQNNNQRQHKWPRNMLQWNFYLWRNQTDFSQIITVNSFPN